MKVVLTALVLLAAVWGISFASDELHLDDSVRVPLPDDWLLGSADLKLPCQLVYINDGAEVLIFRSILHHEEMVTDEIQLRQEVESVVSDVVMTLPGAQLLSTSGYHEEHRAGFLIEFVSTDSSGRFSLHHRLRGHLYRHPDGYQILFTVWGKSAGDTYPVVAAAIQEIEDGFAYDGPQTEEVFGDRRNDYWMYGFLILMLIALLVFRRIGRRNRERKQQLAQSSEWQCHCGQNNKSRVTVCVACGSPHPLEKTRANDS